MASVDYLMEKETKMIIEFIQDNTDITKKTVNDILNWLDKKFYTTGCGYDIFVIFDELDEDTDLIRHLSDDNKEKLCKVLVEISEQAEYGFTWPEMVSADLWSHSIITNEDTNEVNNNGDEDPSYFTDK